jgi:hypothetical protein
MPVSEVGGLDGGLPGVDIVGPDALPRVAKAERGQASPRKEVVESEPHIHSCSTHLIINLSRPKRAGHRYATKKRRKQVAHASPQAPRREASRDLRGVRHPGIHRQNQALA